jgi:hypothetical protein
VVTNNMIVTFCLLLMKSRKEKSDRRISDVFDKSTPRTDFPEHRLCFVDVHEDPLVCTSLV